jgi:hypothetical protein
MERAWETATALTMPWVEWKLERMLEKVLAKPTGRPWGWRWDPI